MKLQEHKIISNKLVDDIDELFAYWEDLLLHTSTYSIVWLFFPLILYFFGIPFSGKILLFILITFIAHTITDYYTSRVNSALWDKGDVHNFFVSVGFDQVLHYVQLFLTYYLLKS